MLKERCGSLTYYRFENLACYNEITHGIFTRLGGVSAPPFASLNVGGLVGDDEAAVRANHELIYAALGVTAAHQVSARQVHGNQVRVVQASDRGRIIPDTDALVTALPDTPLMLRFADCVPIILYDPRHKVIGLAHAGRQGTVAKVAQRTALTMTEVFGCQPDDIRAGIGPSIGPCCYQVNQETVERVRSTIPYWGDLLHPQRDSVWHFNLWEANRRQLTEVGVTQVEMSKLCTACHVDQFFSHRAEGGKTGRFGGLIGIRALGIR
ncbi:MAG: peptidoglycan editing factor PgeF [Anaerolineae bacterium]